MNNAVSKSDRSTFLQQYGKWWPVLLGFAAMALVYVAAAFDKLELFSKASNENIAPILLGISIVGFLLQTIIFRSQFHLLMSILCTALFCREWHFFGSGAILFVTLVLLAFWARKRKELFGRMLARCHLKIWIIATLATYTLSQFVARRVFRRLHLPQEGQLHIHLEETVETTAHLIMIVVCILAWKAVSARCKTASSEKG